MFFIVIFRLDIGEFRKTLVFFLSSRVWLGYAVLRYKVVTNVVTSHLSQQIKWHVRFKLRYCCDLPWQDLWALQQIKYYVFLFLQDTVNLPYLTLLWCMNAKYCSFLVNSGRVFKSEHLQQSSFTDNKLFDLIKKH